MTLISRVHQLGLHVRGKQGTQAVRHAHSMVMYLVTVQHRWCFMLSAYVRIRGCLGSAPYIRHNLLQ